MKRNLAFCLLLVLSACSAGSTRQAPSDMPALPLQRQVDKELALIKKYYDDRHDAAGYATYLQAEQQNVGTNLNDIKRAREQILTSLHIPIPN